MGWGDAIGGVLSGYSAYRAAARRPEPPPDYAAIDEQIGKNYKMMQLIQSQLMQYEQQKVESYGKVYTEIMSAQAKWYELILGAAQEGRLSSEATLDALKQVRENYNLTTIGNDQVRSAISPSEFTVGSEFGEGYANRVEDYTGRHGLNEESVEAFEVASKAKEDDIWTAAYESTYVTTPSGEEVLSPAYQDLFGNEDPTASEVEGTIQLYINRYALATQAQWNRLGPEDQTPFDKVRTVQTHAREALDLVIADGHALEEELTLQPGSIVTNGFIEEAKRRTSSAFMEHLNVTPQDISDYDALVGDADANRLGVALTLDKVIKNLSGGVAVPDMPSAEDILSGGAASFGVPAEQAVDEDGRPIELDPMRTPMLTMYDELKTENIRLRAAKSQTTNQMTMAANHFREANPAAFEDIRMALQLHTDLDFVNYITKRGNRDVWHDAQGAHAQGRLYGYPANSQLMRQHLLETLAGEEHGNPRARGILSTYRDAPEHWRATEMSDDEAMDYVDDIVGGREGQEDPATEFIGSGRDEDPSDDLDFGDEDEDYGDPEPEPYGGDRQGRPDIFPDLSGLPEAEDKSLVTAVKRSTENLLKSRKEAVEAKQRHQAYRADIAKKLGEKLTGPR